ncbi:MAG: helix-turn-helix domain-containing protein [Christensenellaceae bacterium]
MSDNTYNPEPWMGTKEIAEHLGVTVVTVRKWISIEKIPCHRIGKLWKFKASEVDEWVQSGKAGGDE